MTPRAENRQDTELISSRTCPGLIVPLGASVFSTIVIIFPIPKEAQHNDISDLRPETGSSTECLGEDTGVCIRFESTTTSSRLFVPLFKLTTVFYPSLSLSAAIVVSGDEILPLDYPFDPFRLPTAPQFITIPSIPSSPLP